MVPAVTLAGAAPAFAASPTNGPYYGRLCEFHYGDGQESTQTLTIRWQICTADGSALKNGTTVWFKLESDKALGLPVAVTSSWFTQTPTQVNSTTVLIKVVLNSAAGFTSSCIGCSPSSIINYGSGSQVMPAGATVTVSEYHGTATPTAATSPTGTMRFKVAKRAGSSPRLAHRWYSKVGQQGCFPVINFAVNSGGAQLATCGDNGSSSSVIYPDGSCYRLPTSGLTCTECPVTAPC